MRGTSTVTIVGDNVGSPSSAVPVVAAYGPLASEYVVTCLFSSASVRVLNCATLPGIGASLTWTVTVAGQVSNIAPSTTSYDFLTFDKVPAVSGSGAINGSTVGGQSVVLFASNVGPQSLPSSIFSRFIVMYGATASVSPCSWCGALLVCHCSRVCC